MSSLVLFDTSVLVDQLRTDCHRERIRRLAGSIRVSAVVLSELWRGATRAEEREYLLNIEEDTPILVPTEENWLDSGRLLASLRMDCGLEPGRLRNLHFDVLIALTARDHGLRLITSNQADFQLIRQYREFAMDVWPAGQQA